MRAAILVLIDASVAAAQADRDVWPERYDPAGWPVFFSGPIEKSATFCVEVSPSRQPDGAITARGIEFEIALKPEAQHKLFFEGKQVEVSSVPSKGGIASGYGMTPGSHTIEILVRTPVSRAQSR